jgi:hypothetical protein
VEGSDLRGNSNRAGWKYPVSSISDDRDAKRGVWSDLIREERNWEDCPFSLGYFPGLFSWPIFLEYCPEYGREALGMEWDRG